MNTKGIKFLAVLAVLAMAFAAFTVFDETDAAAATTVTGTEFMATQDNKVAEVTTDSGVTTYKLKVDVDLTSVATINGNTVIDLNDHNIACSESKTMFWIASGTVSITGEGKISNSGTASSKTVIWLGNDEQAVNTKASLIVDEKVWIYSGCCYGIAVAGKNTPGQELTIKGKVSTGENSSCAAVSGNGTSSYTSTVVIISSTATIESANAVAIYYPGAGTLTIEGTVTGSGGVEMKAGGASLEVGDNARITANGTKSHNPSSNGPSTNGFAIAVCENDDYKANASFTVKGGVVNGDVALLGDNALTTGKSGTITISGGEINGSIIKGKYGDVGVIPSGKIEITGGTFSDLTGVGYVVAGSGSTPSTVKISKNVESNANINNANAIIDLNGHTVTLKADTTNTISFKNVYDGKDNVLKATTLVVKSDTTIAPGSVYINGVVASGTVEVTGTVEISGSVDTSGTLTIGLADEAVLVVPAGENLDLTGVTINGPATGGAGATVAVLGTVSGANTTTTSTTLANTTVMANNPSAVAEALDIADITVKEASSEVADEAELREALKQGFMEISLKNDITISGTVDLDFKKVTVLLKGHKLTLSSNITFTIEKTKIYCGYNEADYTHGYISIQNGALINIDSDIYCNVEIGDNGSVDNSKAKNQSSEGSSFSEDVSIGYGNTLTISNYTISSNTVATVYGTLIFSGTNKVASDATVVIYGEAIINGSMNMSGSFYDYGMVTLTGTMNVTGNAQDSSDALLFVEPLKANGKDPMIFTYEDDAWGFLVAEDATLNIVKPSTKNYSNTLAIAAYMVSNVEGEVPGFNVFSVDGTLNMNGVLRSPYASSDSYAAVITSSGEVTINGSTNFNPEDEDDNVVIIALMDGVELNITKVDGALEITDGYASKYEAYGLKDTDTNNGENVVLVFGIKGLTVSEEVTTAVKDKTKYFFNNLSIAGSDDSGAVTSIDKDSKGGIGTMSSGKYNMTVYMQSKVIVSGDISLGKGVIFKVGNGLTEIAEGATLTALQDTAPWDATDDAIEIMHHVGPSEEEYTGTMTVYGTVIVGGKNSTKIDINDGAVLNAAMYELKDSEANSVYYYTNADAALAMIATAVEKNVQVFGSVTANDNYSFVKGQSITLTSDKVTLEFDGIVTLEAGAVIEGAGSVEVVGTVTFQNYWESFTAGKISADVLFDEDPARIYTNLADAVSIPGVTEVVLDRNVTLRKDLTVPEDVTVYSPLYGIYVAKNKTVTVEGAIVLTKDTIHLAVPAKEADSPATLIVKGVLITKLQADNKTKPTDDATMNLSPTVAGAHYIAKYNGVDMYYISNVAAAALVMDTGSVNIVGNVFASDVAFSHNEKKNDLTISVIPYKAFEWGETGYALVDKDSTFAMNGIIIDGAILNLENGYATGTVKAASAELSAAEIALTKATGITVTSQYAYTALGTEAYMYLKGTIDGSIAINSGVVTIKSGETFTAPTTSDKTFKIATDAVLDVEGTFNKDGSRGTTIDGTIYVSGTAAKLNVVGATVNGSIVVTEKAEMNVTGTINLKGTIVIDDTQAKEGKLTLKGTAPDSKGDHYAKIVIGTAPKAVGDGVGIIGQVILDDYSYIKSYGDVSVGDVVDKYESAADIVSAKFYVNGTEYMTATAVSGTIPAYSVIYGETFALEGLDNGIKDLYTGLYAYTEKTGKSDCWFTSKAYTADKLISVKIASGVISGTNIDNTYKTFYGLAEPAKVYGTVTVGTGIDLFVDGKNYEPRSYYGEDDVFSVGTHTVYVKVESGYTGDDVTIKFNGQIVPATATGGVFIITADMTTFTLVADGADPYVPPEPEPVTPEEKSEWTVTTILLCVLVVLIAIMAVIVALRLNRN